MRRKSCDNCRDGIACRACGAKLKPLPGLLSERDYALLLAVIDGSDRKYTPKVVDTVMAVLGVERRPAISALQRLRLKLRKLLETAGDAPAGASNGTPEAPADPMSAREEIMRRAKAGEISYDEALAMLEAQR